MIKDKEQLSIIAILIKLFIIVVKIPLSDRKMSRDIKLENLLLVVLYFVWEVESLDGTDEINLHDLLPVMNDDYY